LSSADPPALLGAQFYRRAELEPCSVASIETEGFVLILNRWRGCQPPVHVLRVCACLSCRSLAGMSTACARTACLCLSLTWVQLVPREDEHFECLASGAADLWMSTTGASLRERLISLLCGEFVGGGGRVSCFCRLGGGAFLTDALLLLCPNKQYTNTPPEPHYSARALSPPRQPAHSRETHKLTLQN